MASIGPPMKAELGHMEIELISMELEAPRIDAADLSLGPFAPGNLSYGDVTLKIVEDPDNPIENVVPKTEKISITFPSYMTRMHFAKRSLIKPIVKKAHWVSNVKRKPKKVKYEGVPGSTFEFFGKCHAEGDDTIRIECVEGLK